MAKILTKFCKYLFQSTRKYANAYADQYTHCREKYLFVKVSDLGYAAKLIRFKVVLFKSYSISVFLVYRFSTLQPHVSVFRECSIYVSSLSRICFSSWILTNEWPVSCKSFVRSFLRWMRSFWYSGWIMSFWSIADSSLYRSYFKPLILTKDWNFVCISIILL